MHHLHHQRSSSRPDLHLITVNRGGQRVLQRLDSTHSVQAPYIIHQPNRIQQHVQVPYQQAPKVAKRVEVSFCKENIPVYTPTPGTPHLQPKCQVTFSNQNQQFPALRHQISAPVIDRPTFTAHTATKPQTIAEKDRALTDIGNTMFSSAIFPSNRPHHE